MSYSTTFVYTDRPSKAEYLWRKYESILRGASILDVGADECHLKKFLDPVASYWGVGLGGSPDQQVNLEKEGLPFADGSYDVALCLDVLEHIENPHDILDHLCRVARRHVILSLHNAWSDVWHALRFAPYREGQLMKYYGLPPTHPGDRHKWFFCTEEARRFAEAGARRNGFSLVHMDHSSEYRPPSGFRGLLHNWAVRLLIRPDFDLNNLYKGTSWIVLERPPT